MKKNIISREKEWEALEEAITSSESEMVSVIGRRRVGKTFLIDSVYEDRIIFKLTGIQNATREEQLRNFSNRIRIFFPQVVVSKPPVDWLEAFFILTEILENPKINLKEKPVFFFDELPWLSNRKSGFLKGLDFFWNSWAVNKNVVVVICGSAASWMIKKVLRSKGGLHNRVTKRLHLKPFNLAETEKYLQSRNIFFDHYPILQLYMVTGGIPHYLKEIKGNKSAIQNIEQLCFSDTGVLADEFLSLYDALFENAENHIAIIRALASKGIGLTRKELVEKLKVTDGGRTTRVLEELEQSGFISKFRPFGKKKKDLLYRLTDEYSLFYLRFIENNLQQSEGTWELLSQTQAYKIWSGYAFENICLKHVPQIKKALGVERVLSVSASFLKKGTSDEEGIQIDLLIDRNDQVINLFEIKFYATEFNITKDYAAKLRNKIRIFRDSTKTKKQVFLSMITTFGLVSSARNLGLISDDLDMEVLFKK